MCKPTAVQLKVVRQLQCKINSAGSLPTPPSLACLWAKLLQGREKVGGFHWPREKVELFSWEETESLLWAVCVLVCVCGGGAVVI